ncbi:hypothetical protein [Streptomyces sp. NPDC001530]|uniref:hypothetical protein n=1 Tax=Streptomyces sp. NPDC001530 TaxID=3364582 RepID=UPI0036BBC1C7
MKSLRRKSTPWPGLCTRSAVAALAVMGCLLLGRADERPGVAERVTPGRVCRSALPRGMELSCATYGLVDLRYRCPTGRHDARRCVRTSGVTVRNSGRSRVYVTYIAGARQGVREQGPQRALEPGTETTLRPGGGRWLYDISLLGTEEKASTLEVVRVP